MVSVSNSLRRIAGAIEKSNRKNKLHISKIRVEFKAPKKPFSEALTQDKDSPIKADFQWIKLQILFTIEPDMEQFFVYSIPLESNGTFSKPEKIFDSDSEWGGDEKTNSNYFSSSDIKRAFPDLLEKPDLDLEKAKKDSAGVIKFYNLDKEDVDGKRGYSYDSFKNKFKSYAVLDTTTKDLYNPFGESVGGLK
jgi:hypothetical protein